MEGTTNSERAAEDMMTKQMTANLLPTLLQIFLTVGLGWVAGSLKMLGTKQAQGLGAFVGKFSLPSLIFISLASLDLTNINWSFLLGVLISKSLIFLGVLLLDLFLYRNISRAAIFALYSTQTNDFGIGLPILNSVFGLGHPLVGLLYLVAPISLVILNPIGFVLLELGKNKASEESHSLISTILGVLKGLLMNPLIAMTLLGVLGNLAFSSSPPPYLTNFLGALGASFSALAPFSLGFSMVGKLGNIKADAIKPILGLVAVKSIVTPILTYFLVLKFTVLLDAKPSQMLSNIALLYGIFPTALGVAGYAADYKISSDLVSIAIVIVTLVSAPLLYLVANTLKVIDATRESLAQADHSYIDANLSIVAIVFLFCIWINSKQWRRSPLPLTTSMLLLTLVSSTAGFINSYLPSQSVALMHLTALHASRLSAPFLALHLLLLARSSTALTSRYALSFLALCGPILSMSTLLLLLTPYQSHPFQVYGSKQDLLILVVNCVALLPTLVCLILLSRASNPSIPGIQLFRHSLLLLCLALAMFTSVSHSVAKMLIPASKGFPGAYVALTCGDAILSFGQGVIFLAVFGLDKVLDKILDKIRSFSSLRTPAKIASSFIMIDYSTAVAVAIAAPKKTQHQVLEKEDLTNMTEFGRSI